MERIELDATSVACGAVVGLALGGVCGYLLHRHLDWSRREAAINEAVDEARNYYRARADQAAVGVPVSGEDDELEEEQDDDPEGLLGFHDEVAAFMDDDQDEEREDYQDEDGWPPPNRDRSKPYVISVVEYSDHNVGDGWSQLVLTWYADDNTLVDEFEKLIPDILRTTGPLSVRLFEEANGVVGTPTAETVPTPAELGGHEPAQHGSTQPQEQPDQKK